MLYIITIIIIINSVYYYYLNHKCYLEEKEKATGWEGVFTNKTVWTCLCMFMHLCTNFFCCCFIFLFVSCKKFVFFFSEFNNCLCKFDKNKNENLLKQKKTKNKQKHQIKTNKMPVFGCPKENQFKFSNKKFLTYFKSQCFFPKLYTLKGI